MPRTESEITTKVETMLEEFKNTEPSIQGQMLLAYPAGVPIASSWKGSIDPIIIGAVCAAVRITFQHLSILLKKGNLSSLLVASDQGKVIVQNAGQNAVLTTMVSFDADINRIFFITADQANKFEIVLKNWTYN